MTESSSVSPFVVSSTKSDEEVAQDLISRLEVAIAPALKIMDEAVACGLTINFTVQMAPPYNRHAAMNLSATKHYFKK